MSWFKRFIQLFTPGHGFDVHPLLAQFDATGDDAAIVNGDLETRHHVAKDLLRIVGQRSRKPEHFLLLARMIRSQLPFDAEALILLIRHARSCGGALDAAVLRQVQHFVDREGSLAPPIEAELERWFHALGSTGAERKLANQLQPLLPGVADVPPFDVRCLWGAEVAAWLETLEPPQRAAWLALLRHASLSTGKARPPKRWSSELPALIDAVGTAPLQTKVLGWLAELDLKEARTTRWWSIPQVGPVEANQEVLKGLIWALGPDGDALVATALGRFAQRCFQKIPERGAASLVMGNAVLLTLTTMPDRIGFAELSRLRTCVRYPSARNRIEQLLGEVVVGDVELALEQAVPAFDLDALGERRRSVGTYTSVLRIHRGAAELRFEDASGKGIKSVPKALKTSHPAEVAELKADLSSLKQTLAAQEVRLQGLYLAQREVPIDTFTTHYLEHPVVGAVARRLIWSVDGTMALWDRGALRDLGGSVVEGDAAVLWHPLDLEEELGSVWRDRLLELAIQAPFPQLERDVVHAGDGSVEALVGIEVAQHAFHARCQRNGWRYALQGGYYAEPDCGRGLPGLDIGFGFVMEGVGALERATYDTVRVTAIEFRRAQQPVDPAELPPVVFSEIVLEMRRVLGVRGDGP